jgi:hypothetical protein
MSKTKSVRGGRKQLTSKQRLFLEYYLGAPGGQRNASDLPARLQHEGRAARCRANAQELLKTPKIAAVIAEAS